jgi:hypothetical protein
VDPTASRLTAHAVDAAGASRGQSGAPAPCARCGGDAEADFGTLWLCLACYHVAGSTCAGIGVGPAPTEPVC